MNLVRIVLLLIFVPFFACQELVELDLDREEAFTPDCGYLFPERLVLKKTMGNSEVRFHHSFVNGGIQLDSIESIGKAPRFSQTKVYHYENEKISQIDVNRKGEGQHSSYYKYFYDDFGHMKMVQEFSNFLDSTTFQMNEYVLYETNSFGQTTRKVFYQRYPDSKEWEISRIHEFQWQDCNILVKRILDSEGDLGYEFLYEYDKKLNPYKLQASYPNFQTRNNVISTTTKFHAINYDGGMACGDYYSEVSYIYNEDNFPIEMQMSNGSVVTYEYDNI